MRTPVQQLLNAVERPEVYEEVMITSGGTPIALSIWQGEPGAATVVFLPATMTHPLYYEELLDGISRAGFHVVGVHFQGHGKSPRMKQRLTFDNMVQNGQDAITYAIERFHSPILVLGSSQGGMVATALAGLDKRIAAVFAHNVLLPHMAESLRVTRFPAWLQPFHRVVVSLIKAAAWLTPGLEIPIGFYLDERRIFKTTWAREQFHDDPLNLASYPLAFLASLFSADLDCLRSGQITCPVVVIAATGDPLFTFDYTQRVYEQINAPRKEMLLFETDAHLIFNERLKEVLPRLLDKLREYALQVTVSSGEKPAHTHS